MALLESDPLFQVTSTFSGKPTHGNPQIHHEVHLYNITVVGDSAFVHAFWTFKGQFRIITGISGDTFTYFVKPLYD
jgi:hypothetical protein